MKNGWESKELKAVSQINYGYTESASSNPIGPRFLRITDIQNDRVDWDAVPYCKIPKEDLPKYRLERGDIVFARTGATTGKSFLVSDPPKDAVFASYLIRLRLLDQQLLPEFVSLFFQTAGYWQAIKEGSSGSAQGGFNATKLGALSIPLPTIPEQRRIVGILDEAFAGIATAKANAESNLQNARALFESHLNAIFTQRGDGTQMVRRLDKTTQRTVSKDRMATQTGGRDATTRHIPPVKALAVGMPTTPPSKDWSWTALNSIARMESGHTPSRRHPEYWGGAIPWIGIKDAKINHGQTIDATEENTNDLGIANSSARLLPKGTVCLSRTASVGYVVVMGRPMSTSQDFVNWVCSAELRPEFLKYLFLAESREGLLRYSSGAVHQTIYYPEAKAFHIAHPNLKEQERIIVQCDDLRDETKRLESIYQRKLAALGELKKSLLHQAFSGEL